MTASRVAAIARLALGAVDAHGQGTACQFTTTDSAWVASSLEGWTRTAAREAGAMVRRAPVLVLFDKRCTHTLEPLSGAGRSGIDAAHLRFTVTSTVHGDSIALPNNTRIPAGLTSFASPQPDGRMFFVMSLPSIWATSGRGPRADLLASAVFMHEFTHTQTIVLSARVDTLVARGLPEESDDDVIQKRFGPRPGHTKAYELERDTLLAAAAAKNIADARRLAAGAMRAIDARRARWFGGRDSVYASAEDVFLSLEGMGQWLAFKWLVDTKGGGMREAEALPFIRRGGRWWSQDEGLALLLVAARLSDNAPLALFRERPRTILEVLRGLVAPPSPPDGAPAVSIVLERRPGEVIDDSTTFMAALRAGIQREGRVRVVTRTGPVPAFGFEPVPYMVVLNAAPAGGVPGLTSTLVDVITGQAIYRSSVRARAAEFAATVDSLGARIGRAVAAEAARRQ